MGMPGQEWANTWSNPSVFILFIRRTFPESFIEIWWTKFKICCKTFILDPISQTAPPTFALFAFFYREPEFYEICGFREMLDNNKTLHFRAFPAKTFDSIFHKSPKTLFLAKKRYRHFFISSTKSKSVNITVFENIKNKNKLWEFF